MRLLFREALLSFRRAPLLSSLSVTTIAFSLFAFGLFSLVALNLRSALRQVESRVEIRGFLTEEASPESIRYAAESTAKGSVLQARAQGSNVATNLFAGDARTDEALEALFT